MAKSVPDRIHADLLAWRAKLLRYETKEAQRVQRAYLYHFKDLEQAVRDAVSGRATAAEVMPKVQAVLAEASRWVAEHLEDELTTLLAADYEKVTMILAEHWPGGLQRVAEAKGIDSKIPNVLYKPMRRKDAEAIVFGKVKGKNWKARIDKISPTRAKKVRATIAHGISKGQGMAPIARSVRKQMKMAGYEASRLVRTEVQRVTTSAAEAAYQANKDIIKALLYTATFDTRTCEVCGDLDGTEWNIEDNTKPVVPQHPNCRCLYLPVTKTFKELGLKGPDLSTTERASLKGYTKRRTWSQYVATLNKSQLAEIFGPQKVAQHSVKELLGQKHAAKLGDLDKGVAKHAQATKAAKDKRLAGPRWRGSLTRAEREAIKDWKYTAYESIVKTELQGKPMRGWMADTVRNMDQALIRAKPYTGETFRGLSFSSRAKYERFRKQVSRKGYRFKAHTATSQKQSVARAFAAEDSYGAVLHIRSKSGVDITRIDGFRGEQEVLFRPGAKFRVVEVVERMPEKKWFHTWQPRKLEVHLQEI